jgi:hypothetical protein
VIVEGIDSPDSSALLYSTVHGAGRVHGRKEAKRRFQRAEMDTWLHARGVVLIGGGLDESPMAYRRLPDVLAVHANMRSPAMWAAPASACIRVQHTLRPFAVVRRRSARESGWRQLVPNPPQCPTTVPAPATNPQMVWPLPPALHTHRHRGRLFSQRPKEDPTAPRAEKVGLLHQSSFFVVRRIPGHQKS